MRPEGKSSLKDYHIVSVIIPTIGRESLELCKEALKKQTRPPDELVVIMDNERRGASWARNEGIRRSGGGLITFLDDDCIPPPDWLENLIDALDRHRADGVGGTYEEADPFLSAVRRRRGIPESEQMDLSGLVGTGGNVMYTRQCLEACAKENGFIFDESIRISQDVELAWRLRARGARLVFVPTKVKHLRQETFFSFLRFQFWRGTAIADLHRARRKHHFEVPIQKSLLWEPSGPGNRSRWFRAMWLKLLGPFDYRSFDRPREFLLFWLGEKFQGAGFLFWMVFRTVGSRSPGNRA
jgi:GT2 family glycosyltransferase